MGARTGKNVCIINVASQVNVPISSMDDTVYNFNNAMN